MTTKWIWKWRCSRNGGDFPVIATIAGASSCFAEALLKKHVAPGAAVELIFACLQAVPLAIVLRYLADRWRPSDRARINQGA